MVVPPVAGLPDDTALDMLSYALSGPGVAAAALLAFSGLTVLFSFFEVGPRRGRSPTVFFLRADLSKPTRVELPDGSVRALRQGESVLRLPSREACSAVASRLPIDGLRYSVYRAENGALQLVKEFPGTGVDVDGAVGWPTGVVQADDESALGARWEEYQRIGESLDLNREWQKVLDGLSGVELVQEGAECKLCGGSGYVRCHRCGGVGTSRGNAKGFVCDCDHGKRQCDWCGGGSM